MFRAIAVVAPLTLCTWGVPTLAQPLVEPRRTCKGPGWLPRRTVTGKPTQTSSDIASPSPAIVS